VGLLLASLAAVGWALHRRRPPVTANVALAFVPWMVAGAALRVAALLDAVPEPLAPLATAPAVYGTTAVVAGAAWLAVPRSPKRLAAVGGGVAGLVIADGAAAAGTIDPWPLLAIPAAGGVAGGAVIGYRRLVAGAPTTDRVLQGMVVFGHALDGVSTAVGVDLRCRGPLAACERTPLPRLVMETAAGLPTAELVGVGWLFVVVKVALALGIVHLAAGTLRERPAEGRLLLLAVAALGLGPGCYNVLLFVLGG
jgi:uncharacterized membrane protein